MFLENEAEVDVVENAGNIINNSIEKLKKIIGDIMTSGDPAQVLQLKFVILAVVLELLFSATLLLYRYRFGR